VDPRKIIAITSMPTLTKVTNIKRFWELLAFTKDIFGILLKRQCPCANSSKRDESFNWTKACTRAFEWMKSSMPNNG
jgi:hypothetical protein